MLKKIVIAFGLLISAFVLVVGGLYVKGSLSKLVVFSCVRAQATGNENSP